MKKSSLLELQSYSLIGRDGTIQEQKEEVLGELSLAVSINGIQAGNITCIPEYLDHLIRGRLLTEGIISSAEDIADLAFSQTYDRAEVTLTDSTAAVAGQPMMKSNHTGSDNYPAARPMGHVTPIFWKTEWVFKLADHFAAGTPLHEKTWATHSCILARDGNILFSCEDISRHNALDKVIGFALSEGIPLTRCMVYSSGRIPTDMAAKAVQAGIPILISKASPTAAAVDFARQHSLTLICAARRDRMKLFSGSLPESGSEIP